MKFIAKRGNIASSEYHPINVELIGITFPDENYTIKRPPLLTSVFEYVVSGEGYIIIDENKIKVNAGDTYILS